MRPCARCDRFMMQEVRRRLHGRHHRLEMDGGDRARPLGGPAQVLRARAACPGISPRTLSERLDMLERQGIVGRQSYPESPPRVEYELSAKGAALLPIIQP